MLHVSLFYIQILFSAVSLEVGSMHFARTCVWFLRLMVRKIQKRKSYDFLKKFVRLISKRSLNENVLSMIVPTILIDTYKVPVIIIYGSSGDHRNPNQVESMGNTVYISWQQMIPQKLCRWPVWKLKCNRWYLQCYYIYEKFNIIAVIKTFLPTNFAFLNF